MISKNLPYEVIAYRYGNRDEGYVVGYVCDEITAKMLAHGEQDLRGGKYEVIVQSRIALNGES